MESNDNPQPICFFIPIIYQLDNVLMLYTVVHPNLDLKGGGGGGGETWFFVACPASFFFLCFSFFSFCNQNKERGVGPLGSSLRSATDREIFCLGHSGEFKGYQ